MVGQDMMKTFLNVGDDTFRCGSIHFVQGLELRANETLRQDQLDHTSFHTLADEGNSKK